MLLTLLASCAGEDMVVVGYTVYKPMNYTDESGKLIGLTQSLRKRYLKSLAIL